jgi:hypothetical protein
MFLSISDLYCKCFIIKLQKFISMLHMLLRLYMHVSSTCFKCFIYFRQILQAFHLKFSKVDLERSTCCNCVVLVLRGSP